MDAEDHNDNPSPGGMDEDQLNEMDMAGSHPDGEDMDMQGADDSQEAGDYDEGDDVGPDGDGMDGEEGKGEDDGEGASPVSKKSRAKSMKKKSSMNNGSNEAEKSKDLSKEPRKFSP